MSYQLNETFVYKLVMAQRKIGAILRRDFADSGITQDNYITLHFIYENDGLTQTELAALNGKDHNVIVRTIDRLEQNGLAERRRGIKDRRSFALHITDKGKEVIDKYWNTILLRQEQVLGVLSEDERNILMTSLDKIIN